MNYCVRSEPGTRRVLTIALCIVAAVFPIAIQAEDTEQPQPIRSLEGIDEYSFPNGLKLLLIRDASLSTVTVNLIIRSGSRDEQFRETGVAHLLEHLLFKGTKNFPDVYAAWRQHGVSGGASTWLDSTSYYLTMPATDENLSFGLHMQSDFLQHASLRPASLPQEMPVVRNEYELALNHPLNVLQLTLQQTAFDWHSYGRLTIGNKGDIENMQIETVRRFYETHYQPDNATLVVAGRFDVDSALQLATRMFGKMPRPDRLLHKAPTREPARFGERLSVVRRTGGVPTAGVLYHVPSGLHPDFAAVDVFVSYLVGRSPGHLWTLNSTSSSGVVCRSLLKAGLATEVFSSTSPLRNRGFAEIYARVPLGSDPRISLDAMAAAIESDNHNSITQKWVDTARNRIIRQMDKKLLDLPAFAIQLADWEGLGDWRMFFLHRERVRETTAESVRRVAGEYFVRNNRTGGVAVPTVYNERVAIPKPPSIPSLFSSLPTRNVVEPGEYLEPTPESIANRLDIRTSPGGVESMLIPHMTRGQMARIRLTLHYGNVDVLRNQATVAALLPEILVGTDARSAARKQITGSSSAISVWADALPGTATFHVRTPRQDVALAMEYLYSLLRSPTFSQQDLESFKRKSVNRLRAKMNDPFTLTQRMAMRVFTEVASDDPRSIVSVEEDLNRVQSVSTADLRKFYTDLLDGNHAELVAVGDFDTEEVLSGVDRICGDWKSSHRYRPVGDAPAVLDKATRTAIPLEGKDAAVLHGAMPIYIDDSASDLPALLVAHSAFRASRLAPRIRLENGLSYTYQSNLSRTPHSDILRLILFATCKAEKIHELEYSILDAFDSLSASPLTEHEVNQAISQRQQVLTFRLRSVDSLTNTLADLMIRGKSLNDLSELQDRINSVTVDEVRAAAERYLRAESLHIAVSEPGDR